MTSKLTRTTLCLALTAACSTEDKDSAVNLSLACQLEKCICAHPDRPFFKRPEPEPVLWKKNGDAYCPEGLALEFADKNKN